MVKSISSSYKLVIDRVLKTAEGSFIFVLFANFSSDSNGLMYSLSVVGIFTSLSSFPNVNPYLQAYSLSKDKSMPASYLSESLMFLVIMLLVSLLVNVGISVHEAFLVMSMSLYSGLNFIYLSDNLNKVFPYSVLSSMVLIVTQLLMIYMDFDVKAFFYIKGLGYILTTSLLLGLLFFGSSLNVFGYFSIKEQVALYATGSVFGLLNNLDIMHFSSLGDSNSSMYFTVKKLADFAFVLFTWWGITLPDKFADKFDCNVFFSNILRFFLAVLIVFIVLLFFVVAFEFYFYWVVFFVLYPLMFLLDVYFTSYAVFIDKNHLELYKFSFSLLLSWLVLTKFNVSIEMYPLMYFCLSMLSYIMYVPFLLSRK